LAKREAHPCERKFGARPDVVVQHTDSQSASENLIAKQIGRLHRDVAQNSPAILILDVYPTHRIDLVFQRATANDVQPLFVPAELPEESSQWTGESSGNSKPELEPNSDDEYGALAKQTFLVMRALKFLPNAGMLFRPRFPKSLEHRLGYQVNMNLNNQSLKSFLGRSAFGSSTRG
jgi:hypothetical protein